MEFLKKNLYFPIDKYKFIVYNKLQNLIYDFKYFKQRRLLIMTGLLYLSFIFKASFIFLQEIFTIDSFLRLLSIKYNS